MCTLHGDVLSVVRVSACTVLSVLYRRVNVGVLVVDLV